MSIQFKNVELGKVFKIEKVFRTVIKFEKNIAMLECKQTKSSPITSYEVCICEHDAKKNWYFLPDSEAWGELGWTYNDRNLAETHFQNLLQN